MNPNTRVAICCYQGDAHQVWSMLPLYLQHECPITVLSPADSPVFVPGAAGVNITCLTGGKKCYIGWDGVERMKRHLRLLLDESPEKYFLIHDADSLVLPAVLPQEWYDIEALWSNTIGNNAPDQVRGFAADIPHIAFHPPWFMSRRIAELLLVAGENVEPNVYLPFIDYWMVEACVRGGIPYMPMSKGVSVPCSNPDCHQQCINMASRDQLTVVHSVKGMEMAQPIVDAYHRRGLRA